MSKQFSKEVDGVTYYSNQEVAEKFQVTTYTVRQWIRDGKLRAIKINNLWYTSREEFVRFARERFGPPPGRVGPPRTPGTPA